MLAQIGVNRFNFIYSNIGSSPSVSSPGTVVTPGASDVEGSWTQIASNTDIAQDICLFTIWVSGGATSGQIKNHLLDIGVDPAGGTSYSAVISNIVCGESTNANIGGGLFFVFPLFIKSGSSVAVRIQGSNATAETVQVVASFYGQPSRPELIRVGQYAETIGTVTGSAGVSFTPGNSGSKGSWTSLGTLTRACWWFQLGVQVTNDTTGSLAYHFDLAYGDATNKHIIIQDLRINTAATEAIAGSGLASQSLAFADLSAGTELWVRGTCSSTANAGWNAVAIGIGG